jgi:poly-gamma-glutamate synthesis protein (capsule biosynthesis protein)
MTVLSIALCGDVMTGRGVDQILPYPGDPRLHERYAASALDYVELAERVSGAIPRKVEWDYIWGAALETLRAARPDAFIINLETAVTESTDFEPKGINYRMHPANTPCLVAAGVDCCSLANNHVLDWGASGLADTLRVLAANGMRTAGAGLNTEEAAAPAIIDCESKGRILVYAFAAASGGAPGEWGAGEDRPVVNFLADLSSKSAAAIAKIVRRKKQKGDVAIASIHWGSNWGYAIPESERRFARMLVDESGIDIVYGHSSHHPKALEIHNGRPILYGCGDFLNDYEGISGREAYRADLVLLYLARVDAAGAAAPSIELAPFRIRRFRLTRLSDSEYDWLHSRLRREYQPFGADLDRTADRRLRLRWPA